MINVITINCKLIIKEYLPLFVYYFETSCCTLLNKIEY